MPAPDLRGWAGVRFCGWCKRQFEPSRREQLYCNDTHKKFAQRARTRALVAVLFFAAAIARGASARLASGDELTICNGMQTVDGVILHRVLWAMTTSPTPPLSVAEFPGTVDPAFYEKGGCTSLPAPTVPGTYWLHGRWEYSGPQGENQSAVASRSFRVLIPGLYTLSPCRVFDTRGDFPLYAGQRRVFAVGGRCGVPDDADSVAANLTIVSPTAAGNLTVWPDGPQPGTSSINYKAGAVRANNAILKLGQDGTVSVFCAQAKGQAHLVLDVAGYFDQRSASRELTSRELSSAGSNAPLIAALGVASLIGSYVAYRMSRSA